MSAMVNVLAAIGMIFVLVTIIYYIWKYFSKLSKDAELSKIRPSPMYMQTVGVKCPDYWEMTDSDKDDNYVCKDVMGLMKKYGKENTKCVYKGANGSDLLMKFAPYDDSKAWDEMKDEDKIDFMKLSADDAQYYSRADWIKNCGPNVGTGISTTAVWSGLEKYA
jgi:hypothetical protein